MIFDAPITMKTLGSVRILRSIKVDSTTFNAVVKALGLGAKKKKLARTTIYIVQEAPVIGKKRPKKRG
jgi:hypothetical protein